MSSLTVEQVLKEKQTRDPDSVKELNLGHRALSDVSCLSKFRNLEKLDLRFNNLTDLQGLKSCVNLKWLSLVENKLQSLTGIEGLTKLTVLNAGKNKLKSMTEVSSLVNLRALILNDNEISSICKLDQLKELNSLVLSRNPISEIGDSLSKLKKLSKISLSHCRIKAIGSSLKSCSELIELRLAHNEIKTLPAELALNKRLLNMDVGNNLIMKLSEIEVLGSLSCLRNLNMRGNPIFDNEKLAKKVKKLLLPSVNVFNAKSLQDKSSKKEKHTRFDTSDETFDVNHTKPNQEEEAKEDQTRKKSSKVNKSEEDQKIKKSRKVNKSEEVAIEDDKSKKKPKSNSNLDKIRQEEKILDKNVAAAGEIKQKTSRPKEEVDAIDDTETSFEEFFSRDNAVKVTEKKRSSSVQETGLVGVTDSQRNKKKQKQSKSVVFELPQEIEIGMGGESKWV